MNTLATDNAFPLLPTRSRSWSVALSYLLAVGFGVVALVPWTHEGRVFGELDASWHQVMQYAWSNGLHSGTDVVFTMGPIGFAFRGFDPQTYYTTLVVWLVIVVPFALAAQWTALRLFARPASAGMIGAGVALLWSIALMMMCDVRFPLAIVLGPMVLLAMNVLDDSPAGTGRARAWRGVVVGALVASLALGALVKFTFLAGASVAVISTALNDVLHRRRAPWPAGLYVVSLVVFWWVAGQPMSGAWPYVRSALEITSGYAGAMSADPPDALGDVVGFVLPAGFALVLVALAGWRVARWRGVVVPVGLVGVTFILFKSAYVRHSAMQYTTALVGLIPLAWTFMPWVWRRVGNTGRTFRAVVRVASILVMLASVISVQALYGRHVESRSFTSDLWQCVVTLPARAGQMLSPVQTRESLSKEFEEKQSRIRQATPLPPLQGTVDVYSYRQDVLFAHHLPYAPRPVFQSYAAYTPWLARLNADHLLTDRAAETILFDLTTIDERYPSLDDALSWPALLTRYDVQAVTPDFLILHRAPAPRQWHLEPIQTISGRLGTSLQVPDSPELIWAEIDVRPTRLGSGLALVYKPPVVTMRIDTRGAGTKTFRLVPAMARGGFLLSPFVETREAWRAIARGTYANELSGARVQSITIDAPASSFQPEYEVKLFNLSIDNTGTPRK